MKLYSSLADWWPLLSSPADYADEAKEYWKIMSAHAKRPIRTMLELGCGGGNNAVHLKNHCRMTLTDLSPQMLAVSRELNPECEHIEGDMRTLRLGREFDAVFVHDAIMYLRTENELRQAMAAAFAHCVPGGAVLFAPDCTKEDWSPCTDHGGHDAADGGRSLRYFEWTIDPDPSDTQFTVDMVYLLREPGGRLHVEHERHLFGLFPKATWLRLLEGAGFSAASVRTEPGRNAAREVFVGLRREAAG